MPVANSLPVAVIGAGPVGLAAAAHLIEKGETPVILEAGATVAAGVRSWGHVKLFSPWRYCIDEAARRLLDANGWQSPDLEAYPTGRELADRYLIPLAETPAIKPHVRTGARVVSVTRFGFDKMKNAGRNDAPFALTLDLGDGREELLLARAVIDASGTLTSPNPLGSSGIPALGERTAGDRIAYRIPDVLGLDRARYVGNRTIVVGSGHSAFNVLIELSELTQEAGGEVVWLVRKTDLTSMYGGEVGDALPERGALGARVRALVVKGLVRLETGFRIAEVHSGDANVTLRAEDGREVAAEEIVATTGFRPNLAMLSELRLDLHPAVESPTILADMIDPNFHSCGTVDPHGAVQLAHPEKDFYIVGMKSYGRAPTFLMLTGYEQVRSIACALTGDQEGAEKVDLVLPETGVCSGDGCCTPPPSRKTIKLEPLPLSKAAAKAACCGEDSDCC